VQRHSRLLVLVPAGNAVEETRNPFTLSNTGSEQRSILILVFPQVTTIPEFFLNLH
jgi:hypothetical protein